MAEHEKKSATGTQDVEEIRRKKKSPEPMVEKLKAQTGEPNPYAATLEAAMDEPSPEKHAALLGDPRFSHSANNTQKARMVTELQGTYGNAYMQRVVNHIQAERDEQLSGKEVPGDITQRIAAERSSGQPLEPEVRSQMEASFGHNFDDVRIHADTRADRLAQELGAKAFTTGKDVFFREGNYQPGADAGKALLAHELTHVVQQRGNAICSGGITDEPIANRKSEDLFEQEAGRVAEQVVGGRVDSRQNLEIRNSEESDQRDVEGETRQSEKVETRTVSFNVTLVPQKGAKSISHLSGCSRRGFIQCQRTAYFVIGDRGLNVGGGVFLQTTEDLRDRLVTLSIEGEWSLIVSIHGSEHRVVNAARADAPGAVSYNAAAIERIFGSAEFRQWRDQWGPVRIVLNACQVSAALESTIIKAITKPPPQGQLRQAAQGLGTGCRPVTEGLLISIGGAKITTRQQYKNLSLHDQQTFERMVGRYNTQWGYFGIPPVPPEQTLDYYFDEAPKGRWVVVKVSVNRVPQEIPFWNRAINSEFRRLCRQGVVTQYPERQPVVPPTIVTP